MPCRNYLVGSAIIAVANASAFAQTTPASAPAPPVTKFTLGGDASYSFDTDLHDDGGSFSVFRSDSSVRVDHSFNADTSMSLTFDGEWSHYFFRNIAAVPGDDGSDSLDAYQFDLRPTVSHYFNDDLGVFGGVTITAAGMSNAALGDSLTYGVFAGVNYRLTNNVWIGAGVSVFTQLEDDPFVVPLLTLRWDVSKDFWLASDGLGLRATYKLDENWSVYARGRYDYRQFRLNPDEVIADGVLTDQSVPVAVGLTYDFGDSLAVTAEAGVVAWRRLEFRDRGGNDVGADEADPSAFVSVQVRMSF